MKNIFFFLVCAALSLHAHDTHMNEPMQSTADMPEQVSPEAGKSCCGCNNCCCRDMKQNSQDMNQKCAEQDCATTDCATKRSMPATSSSDFSADETRVLKAVAQELIQFNESTAGLDECPDKL